MDKAIFGFHLSVAGSISNAPMEAKAMKYGAFQMFVTNSRSWKTRALADGEVDAFKRYAKGIVAVAHMPYLCNPSSANASVLEKSRLMFEQNISRCEELGIKYLVVHPGSHLGTGFASALKRIEDTVALSSKTMVLFENMSGYQNSVGSKLSELGSIIDALNGNTGICFDTCHAYAAGYDITSKEGIEKAMDEIKEYIGLEKVKVVHLNDSVGELGSGLDRHWHIGKGKIGRSGFINFFRFNKFGNIPCIMELPENAYGNNEENLKAAKELAKIAGLST